VETLTTQSRQALKISVEEQSAQHTVVVGYGTRAGRRLRDVATSGTADIVVVDENATALERAKSAAWITVTATPPVRCAAAGHPTREIDHRRDRRRRSAVWSP